jgi:hypothetical protein
MAMSHYAAVLNAMGRAAEAEPLARQAVARAKASAVLGPKHARSKDLAAVHADCLAALGRRDEAAAIRREFDLPDPATRPATNPG